MRERIVAYMLTGLVCFTLLIGLLFAALWQYKEIVGWTLFGLFVAFAVVLLARLVNELFLRHLRYQYREEMPLGASHYPIQGTQTTGPYTLEVLPNAYYQPKECGIPPQA
jgi:hypothetical protein